jgi:YD repeat-containing protein
MTFDGETHVLRWTPGYTQAGTYGITFHVTDDGDGTGAATADAATLTVEVRDANAAPQVAPVANQTVKGGETLDVSVSASDSDGERLTFSAAELPAFATLADHGDGTATLHAAPALGDRGNYAITITAQDTGNGNPTAVLSHSQQFVLSVRVDNAPPVMEAVGGKVALLGQELAFDVRVEDADYELLTYSAAGLPAGAVFEATPVYGVARFRWTPAAAFAGDVTLQVEDSGNGVPAGALRDAETIRLVARNTNAAPVLQPVGSQEVAEGQTLMITLAATDADGDTVTFGTDLLPYGAQLDHKTGLFTWTPAFDQAGPYAVRFLADDGNRSSSELVTINVLNVNQAPVFVPITNLVAQEGIPLSFSVTAGDADSDALAYYLEGAVPRGLQFDSGSGYVSWTPGYDLAGLYTLRFGAKDAGGLADSLDMQVQVLNVNRAPVLPSLGGHVALVGQEFDLAVPGSDPDTGANLVYSATDLPPGVTFDAATGRLRWRPAAAQVGTYYPVITVSDGSLKASQPIELVASLQSVPPAVLIELTPSFPVTPGQSVLIHVAAAGVADIQSLALSVDGQPVTLDSQGRYRYTPQAPGHVALTASATDADGVRGVAECDLKIRDPADADAPLVELDLPPDGAVLTSAADVVGSIADTNLDAFTVEIADLGSEDFHILASGRVPGQHLVLARLDSAAWPNGAYRLRLSARDIGGRTAAVERVVEVASTAKAGAYETDELDVRAVLDGIPVEIRRYYSTVDANQTGLVGYGWRLAVLEGRLSTNVAPTGTEAAGVFPAFGDGTRLYLNLPDGSRGGFAFTPVRHLREGVEWYAPAWTADAGIPYVLESVQAALDRVDGRYYWWTNGIPYNPASPACAADAGGYAYRLTAPDDTRFILDAQGNALEILAADGRRLVVNDSGIVAPSGQRLGFEHDRQGRLAAVTAPDGSRLLYRYDDAGNLLTVNDLRTGALTWYGYAGDRAHFLSIAAQSQPSGGEMVRYDAAGRVAEISPLDGVLGATRQFLGQSSGGQLAPGETRRYAFVLGGRELATSLMGRLTLGVEVRASDGLAPAAPQVLGVTAADARTEAARSVALFTVGAGGA